jgi:hypothetical protein
MVSQQPAHPSPGRKVVFAFITAALVLVSVDLLAGITGWFVVKKKQYTPGLLTHAEVAAHPYRSYISRPGQKFWDVGMGRGTVSGLPLDFGLIPGGVVVDQYGHQVLPADVDLHARPKQAGEYRILFLGGSTTFQTWPFFVAEALTEAGVPGKITIINAGTGGYTSQENVVDLAVCGFAYDPDLVIAYLPVNDVGYAAHWPGFKRDYTHMRTPLEVVSAVAPPQDRIRRYPFTLKLYDVLAYNRRLDQYLKAANLTYKTTHQPDPMVAGHIIDDADFDKTAQAVVDNVFDMKVLCEARGVKFLLLTQKMFTIDNPYMSVIYARTLECSQRIRASGRLRGLWARDMQTAVPETWDAAAIVKVRTAFPHRMVDFDQPLTYDDMHFTPGGLFLFAAVVAEEISPVIAAKRTETRAE